jgi:hypothetical protein
LISRLATVPLAGAALVRRKVVGPVAQSIPARAREPLWSVSCCGATDLEPDGPRRCLRTARRGRVLPGGDTQRPSAVGWAGRKKRVFLRKRRKRGLPPNFSRSRARNVQLELGTAIRHSPESQPGFATRSPHASRRPPPVKAPAEAAPPPAGGGQVADDRVSATEVDGPYRRPCAALPLADGVQPVAHQSYRGVMDVALVRRTREGGEKRRSERDLRRE